MKLPNRPFIFVFLAQLTFFAAIFPRSWIATDASERFEILPPRLEKELGKATEALRVNKPADARKHLDTVSRAAPRNPEMNFLFGIYAAETNDWTLARGYWQKALVVSPSHFGSLLSLAYALIREGKFTDAVQLLDRALEAEPMSWRAHALLADAYLRQGMYDDSIEHAERALQLGHSQAELVQALLARARDLQTSQARETDGSQNYAPGPARYSLPAGEPPNLQGLLLEASEPADAAPALSAASLFPASALLASRWMPPDVDETMPAVESGVACNREEVLEGVAKRLQEFIADVDRFTTTETVTHQSINRWGLASRPLKFEFPYVVEVKKNVLGFLTVQEYRGEHYSATQFPDGVSVTGLPALVLIFHPTNVENFETVCEGLSQSNGMPAWQIYFRQRPDKPNTIKSYQIGMNGPVYPIALKGRAWIAADTFQIIRLETDLMTRVPEIRLVADHAAIEYAPVHFSARNVDMWLPKTAEVHYDWRGRRSHRRHSFRNYLLFSIDDQQQISGPKAGAPKQ